MKYLFLSVCVFAFLCKLVESTEEKPSVVVELFRHGARDPLNSEYDPTWGKTEGTLLPSGIRQHFGLGRILGQKYSHLLQSYNSQEIFAKATSSPRVVMSLASQIYGAFQGKAADVPSSLSDSELLPPFQDQARLHAVSDKFLGLKKPLPNGYQPFTSRNVNYTEDDFLLVAPWVCHQVALWQFERETDKIEKRNTELFNYLYPTVEFLRKKGVRIEQLKDLVRFGDTLLSNHYADKALPYGVEYNSTVYNDSVFAFNWYSAYNYVGDNFEKGLKIRNLLAQTIDWFKAAANGTSELKFAFLSGHETSLFPLLGLYKIMDHECLLENYKSHKLGEPIPYPDCKYPEFASQVIYEFYNKTDGPYVKFLYDGTPFKICSKSEGVECSLNDFIEESQNLYHNLTRQDFDNYCQAPEDNTNMWLIITIGILTAVISILLFVLTSQRKAVSSQNKTDEHCESTDDIKVVVIKN